MDNKVKILGFAGSLRKGSYNRAILRAAAEMLPRDTELDIFDLEGLPPFNQDLEMSPVAKVKEFKSKIRAADAIMIATPENNYSIPGVLTNALAWGSRPYGDNAFQGKPVAIMSASVGMLGGARAQYHLRQTFVFLDMYSINMPEVMVPVAQQKIDEKGKVTDETTRQKIKELVAALVSHTRKMRAAAAPV